MFTLSASVLSCPVFVIQLTQLSSSTKRPPVRAGHQWRSATSPVPHPLLHRSTAPYLAAPRPYLQSRLPHQPSAFLKWGNPPAAQPTCTSTCRGEPFLLPFQLFQLALPVPYTQCCPSSCTLFSSYHLLSSLNLRRVNDISC